MTAAILRAAADISDDEIRELRAWGRDRAAPEVVFQANKALDDDDERRREGRARCAEILAALRTPPRRWSVVDTKALRAKLGEFRAAYGDENVNLGLAISVRALDVEGLLDRIDALEAACRKGDENERTDARAYCKLLDELQAMTKARDEACNIADSLARVLELDTKKPETLQRISTLRGVGK